MTSKEIYKGWDTGSDKLNEALIDLRWVMESNEGDEVSWRVLRCFVNTVLEAADLKQ